MQEFPAFKLLPRMRMTSNRPNGKLPTCLGSFFRTSVLIPADRPRGVHCFLLKAPLPSGQGSAFAAQLFSTQLPRAPAFILRLSSLLGLSFQVKLGNLFILLCNVFQLCIYTKSKTIFKSLNMSINHFTDLKKKITVTYTFSNIPKELDVNH